jgi:hypothetical protein
MAMKFPSLSPNLTDREYACVLVAQRIAPTLNRSAAQHLTDGFARRLLLMQTNRVQIENIAGDRDEILHTEECSVLNVHLNSFYVQMRGALDNLAWALHHQFTLFGDADESDARTRRKIGLFDDRFGDALKRDHGELREFINERRPWFADFSERRDPVAHRLPLFAPPGIVFEGSSDAAQAERLNVEMKTAYEKGDLDGGFNKFLELTSLGEYVPSFVQFGVGEYTVRPILPTIAADESVFLDLAERVLGELSTDQ